MPLPSIAEVEALIPGIVVIPTIVAIVELIKFLWLLYLPAPTFPLWQTLAGVGVAASYIITNAGLIEGNLVTLALNAAITFLAVSGAYDTIAKPLLFKHFAYNK